MVDYTMTQGASLHAPIGLADSGSLAHAFIYREVDNQHPQL